MISLLNKIRKPNVVSSNNPAFAINQAINKLGPKLQPLEIHTKRQIIENLSKLPAQEIVLLSRSLNKWLINPTAVNNVIEKVGCKFERISDGRLNLGMIGDAPEFSLIEDHENRRTQKRTSVSIKIAELTNKMEERVLEHLKGNIKGFKERDFNMEDVRRCIRGAAKKYCNGTRSVNIGRNVFRGKQEKIRNNWVQQLGLNIYKMGRSLTIAYSYISYCTKDHIIPTKESHIIEMPLHEGEIKSKGSYVEDNMFFLGEIDEVKIVGNKGAGFSHLKALGIQFPKGIVISSKLVRDVAKGQLSCELLAEYVIKKMKSLEIDMDIFEWGYKPRVSVRSSPESSMPGQLATELNVTEGILADSIKVVIDSFKKSGLENSTNMAVIIQKMINPRSGMSGVLTSRDPNTAEKRITGHYIKEKLGDELMTKGEKGEPLEKLKDNIYNLEHYQLLCETARNLEEYFEYPQEIEFVSGVTGINFLQTRNMSFPSTGEYSLLKERQKAGRITDPQMIVELESIQRRQAQRTLYRVRRIVSPRTILRGLYSTPGAMQGKLVFDPKAELDKEQPYIFWLNSKTRKEFLDRLFGFPRVGLITTYGNDSSHEAVLSRKSGIPSLINVTETQILLGVPYHEKSPKELLMEFKKYRTRSSMSSIFKVYHGNKFVRLDGVTFKEGDTVVLDGNNNRMFAAKKNVLEEDRSIFDASYGIDINEYRKEVIAPYLNPDGTLKTAITKKYLIGLYKEVCEENDRVVNSIDTREGIIANLRKHFIHELLQQVTNVE